jgi:hypothetical protein
MAKKSDGPDPAGPKGQFTPAPADATEATENSNDELMSTAATVGVVAIGALIFEAALLPGMVLGVCAMLAPKALPKVGTALNPLFKSAVRGAYQFSERAKEMAAEMQEQVHDIVAEVKSEADAQPKRAAPPGA